VAGAQAERQEQGVVDSIKKAIKTNAGNAINIQAGKVFLGGVIGAEKFTGRQVGGSEPYTDVIIKFHESLDLKDINLSLKGESAPSLAGGGLKGLELAVPGIAKKFMKAAYTHLKDRLKLSLGSKVPDIYGKINNTDKKKIVIGNKEMGGPIDYMYIGKMDVNAYYDEKNNTLTFRNGQLIPADTYANEHDLFFRLRARREDQRFDPKSKDSAGVPKIYGKSPSKGDSAGRIVVTDKVPTNAVVITLT
jgi:hypothetical protein